MSLTNNQKVIVNETEEIIFGGYTYNTNEINKLGRKYIDSLIDETAINKKDKLSKKDIGRFFGLINDFGKLNFWLKHKELQHPEPFNSKKDFQNYYNNFIGVPEDIYTTNIPSGKKEFN